MERGERTNGLFTVDRWRAVMRVASKNGIGSRIIAGPRKPFSFTQVIAQEVEKPSSADIVPPGHVYGVVDVHPEESQFWNEVMRYTKKPQSDSS